MSDNVLPFPPIQLFWWQVAYCENMYVAELSFDFFQVIERMHCDALVEVEDSLVLEGSEGKEVKLVECDTDVVRYSYLLCI